MPKKSALLKGATASRNKNLYKNRIYGIGTKVVLACLSFLAHYAAVGVILYAIEIILLLGRLIGAPAGPRQSFFR